jgi:phosphoglycerol transferase MdoB-like AlkP superfamily enzyme
MANDLSAREEPSFNYFVSFTSHSPHSSLYINNYNLQNGDSPDIKLYNSPINPDILKNIEIEEKTIRPYLSQLTAVDQSLEHFFKRLEKYDLLEKSIILIYNDHRYYNFFPDDTVENFYNYNELPFVMVLPKQNKVKLQDFASHIDLAPTILDLLDYEEELPETFIGTSLFSNEHPNFAINKCLDQITYIDNNVLIKGNAKNAMYNIAHLFNENMNFYSYIPALSEYIELSDKILKDNKLK